MKKYREKFLETRKYACKRCSFKFFNNIKFHQHVQNYHQKKFKLIFFEIFISSEVFALIFTFNQIVSFIFNELALFVAFSQMTSKSSLTSSFTSFSTFFIILFTFILFAILFATSKKQIFWAKIASKSIISSKFSRLSRFASKIQSISTSSLSTKIYLTMNNLFIMFNEKSKSLDLSHRQKSLFFSHYWQLNKFISYQTRITTYFLSSLNSLKFNILSKLEFCLFIQTSVFRCHIFFDKQNINFASRIAFFFDCFINIFHICRRCQ